MILEAEALARPERGRDLAGCRGAAGFTARERGEARAAAPGYANRRRARLFVLTLSASRKVVRLLTLLEPRDPGRSFTRPAFAGSAAYRECSPSTI